jgi:hypothetical protein
MWPKPFFGKIKNTLLFPWKKDAPKLWILLQLKKPAQSKESPYGRQKLFLKKRRRGERKFRHRRQKKKN